MTMALIADVEDRFAEKIAVMVAEHIGEAIYLPSEKAVEKTLNFLDYLKQELNDMKELLKCHKLLMLNEWWYTCLLNLWEAGHIDRLGFTVEADVSPSSTYTYDLNLTATDKACVCPVLWIMSDLGGYVKCTNIVNLEPVDIKSRNWLNKYALPSVPMPSVMTQFPYVRFPKRRVTVTFSNEHTTQTAHCIFHADYLEMDFNYALQYMENIYGVITRELERIIVHGEV